MMGSLAPRAELRIGITLALHGDTSRLEVMLHSREQWNASIVIAVLVHNSGELERTEEILAHEVERTSANIGGTLRWCAYLPPRLTVGEAVNSSTRDALWQYPANIMRNRALQLVETQQVMLLDADFLTPHSMRHVARVGLPHLLPGQILIVPPFQVRGSVRWAELQKSGVLIDKQALIRTIEQACVSTGIGNNRALAVAPYPRYLGAAVNYRLWWSAKENYTSPNISETEPYYIANTVDHLVYDERFVGYGADKAEQYHRVMLSGATKIVSPDFFIVHVNVGSNSTRAFFESGVNGNWGEDEHALVWKQSNIELFNDLMLAKWPANLQHMANVKWRTIYPSCVLENPAIFEWALGPIAHMTCYTMPSQKCHVRVNHVQIMMHTKSTGCCFSNCSAWQVSWGGCQPPVGQDSVCNDPEQADKLQLTACPTGEWVQDKGWHEDQQNQRIHSGRVPGPYEWEPVGVSGQFSASFGGGAIQMSPEQQLRLSNMAAQIG